MLSHRKLLDYQKTGRPEIDSTMVNGLLTAPLRLRRAKTGRREIDSTMVTGSLTGHRSLSASAYAYAKPKSQVAPTARGSYELALYL